MWFRPKGGRSPGPAITLVGTSPSGHRPDGSHSSFASRKPARCTALYFAAGAGSPDFALRCGGKGRNVVTLASHLRRQCCGTGRRSGTGRTQRRFFWCADGIGRRLTVRAVSAERQAHVATDRAQVGDLALHLRFFADVPLAVRAIDECDGEELGAAAGTAPAPSTPTTSRSTSNGGTSKARGASRQRRSPHGCFLGFLPSLRVAVLARPSPSRRSDFGTPQPVRPALRCRRRRRCRGGR